MRDVGQEGFGLIFDRAPMLFVHGRWPTGSFVGSRGSSPFARDPSWGPAPRLTGLCGEEVRTLKNVVGESVPQHHRPNLCGTADIEPDEVPVAPRSEPLAQGLTSITICSPAALTTCTFQAGRKPPSAIFITRA